MVNAETHAAQSMENKLLWVLSCWWDVYNKSPFTSSMQLGTLKGGVKILELENRVEHCKVLYTGYDVTYCTCELSTVVITCIRTAQGQPVKIPAWSGERFLMSHPQLMSLGADDCLGTENHFPLWKDSHWNLPMPQWVTSQPFTY